MLGHVQLAICNAATNGCMEAFQQVVQAGLAAAEAAGAAAAEDDAATMDVLEYALWAAAESGNGEMVGWVLQLGQGYWTPEHMHDALKAAAEEGRVKVLGQLLSNCGIIWTPAQLSVHLDYAAQDQFGGKHMIRRVLAAAAASEEEWLVEHLVDALASAAAHATFHAAAADAVKLLLRYPGIVWTCADLQPAVEAAAAHSTAETWRTKGDSIACCRSVAVLKDLIRAATDQWTAEQLSLALCDTVLNDSEVNFSKILTLESVQWTVPTLYPAMEVACRPYHLRKEACFFQMLSLPGLEWDEDQFYRLACLTIERESWPCLRALLQQEGVEVPIERILQMLGVVVGTRATELMDALVQPQRCRDRDFIVRVADVSSLMSQCMQRLLELGAGACRPSSLRGALSVAAAAGDAGLVSATLAAVSGEEVWSTCHVQVALQAAVRAKHWGIVTQLLAAPAGGWKREELQEVVAALEGAGAKKVVEMLWQRALPFMSTL